MKKGTQHKEETKQKISESMLDNDNALVWDEGTTLDAISKVYNNLIEDNNEYTLSGAILSVEEYDLYADWWSNMSNNFKGVETVIRAIKKVESLLEKRIVNNTMTGDAKSATFSIFLLKNKFGYVDKQENENTHKITGVDLKSAINFTDDNTSS